MGTARRDLVLTAKAGIVAVLATASVFTVTASAQASFTGNTVEGCYGIGWTRDWNQECVSGGAKKTGNFRTDADCNNSGDKTLTRYRQKGDGQSVDGEDCFTGSLRNLTTWFRP
ncbi:hypothetical protein [Micromonospora maris]|uniref:hypothetical protein n=1 Tax=Micromonospora TaxID=1873 RepID=UPI000206BFF5|nr:hypothetical protein [Micromonospora maris]AEB42413.1 hypothetical protein VAB18032_06445 [Micromonospora maris AB-18-032]